MDVKSLTIEGLNYFKDKQDAFNDSKFATKASIPTKLSELQNDALYQTKSDVDSAISAQPHTKVTLNTWTALDMQ